MNTERIPSKCVLVGMLLAATLGAPQVAAQTADDFQRLKAMVEQMQKTIEAQNARIAELEAELAALKGTVSS